MSKQSAVSPRDAPQPVHRRAFAPPESSVFPSRPSSKGFIEMAKDLNTFRAVKPSVIVHPATHCGVHESRQILQMLVVTSGGHPPFSDSCTYRFGSFGAHRWQKAHKMLSPAILCPPRLEGVAQKVELYRSRLPRSIVILAIYDASLCCIELKTALQEATSDGFQYLPGLPLAPAVDDGIVRITLELDMRECPLHPEIERVMQEEISQQRTSDPTLRRAFGSLLQSVGRFLHGSPKPPRNIQPHPRNVGMVCHSTLNQVMRNGIKGTYDILPIISTFPKRSPSSDLGIPSKANRSTFSGRCIEKIGSFSS
jgi:hypothetical protein